MGNINVTLLGGFAAAVDGVPVPDTAWRLKKARELIKLLALAPGHRMHREQAMDMLWRDRDPAAAANNLHQAIFVARRALDAETIELRDEVLLLTADVDVDRLERAAADARNVQTPAAYGAALELYRGELLPENRYEDWAAGRREELAELVTELADELKALDHAGADRLRSLPVDASSFIGRDRELSECRALLRGTRLLTLAGTGGVGKTRLALELARAAEPAYRGGAALVELAALADPGLVPDAVAAALDVRALSGQTLVDAVIGFLSPRSLLLVIDNCEHLIAATAKLVDALLRSAPDLTILATSREPLRVAGEVIFRVPSLRIPDPEASPEPAQLMRYEAVRLLIARADAAAPGFAIDEQNAVDIARICFRLDGLPLALELAASRLGTLGPGAIAARLEDRFRLLSGGSKAAPTRQHTLAATLRWSHDLLASDERTLFRRLAVFTGGFELKAVEDVCTGGVLDGPGIADVLARLVEKSLVTVDEGSSRLPRYRLLETVRLYALEQLLEAAETVAVADRHARWALALAEAERRSPRLDRDAANLRAALDVLLRRAPREALRFCVALWPFWMRRIDLHEAQQRFDDVLAAAPERVALRAEALLAAAAIQFRSGTLAQARERVEESYAIASEIDEPYAQWRALQFLGEFGVASDAADLAIPWLERALGLAKRERFTAAEAICVYSLAVAHWILGDLARAETLVARSIELFLTVAGSSQLVMSPVNMAEIPTRQLTSRSRLRVVFEDTLQPFVEISCDAAVSYALANRAAIARARGDRARARMLLEESAARFQAAGDEVGTAAVHVRRAYLELAEGDLAAARQALEAALELRRAQRDRRGLGLVLAGLGLIDTTAGDYQSADRHLAEAREIFRRAGDRWGLASTLWRTADLACERGRLDEAEGALWEARDVLSVTQRKRWIAHTLAGLAEVALLRGDREQASVLFAEAHDLYEARDDALGVADIEVRLRSIAKDALSARKERPNRTVRTL
jgi:predicted ATPase